MKVLIGCEYSGKSEKRLGPRVMMRGRATYYLAMMIHPITYKAMWLKL